MTSGLGVTRDPRALSGRMAWADIARALSIILVVSYHAGVSGIGAFLPSDVSRTTEHWRTANLILVPLRMPLFFVVSGMLAASALSRPWRKVSRPRVFNLLWAYLLWSVIFAATAWPRYAPETPWEYFQKGMRDMVVVASPYWFIAALPLFFLVTRWCRSRPWLLLAALFGVYLASPYLVSALRELGPEFSRPATGVRRLTEYAVWFAAGYVLSGKLKILGAKKRPRIAAVASIVCVPLCWMAVMGDLSTGTERVVKLAASISSILAVLALSTLLGALPAVAQLGRHIGSRTLVIYLIHPLVLNVCVVLGWRFYEDVTGPVPLAAEFLVLPCIILLCLLVSLWFKRITDQLGADWLYELPGGGGSRAGHLSSRRPL
ncbi:MAG: acyltransferase [Actinomycetales bacterium]|nr:acyltransferase [Actinomycetales bacterium]